jgi:hypothetical protein
MPEDMSDRMPEDLPVRKCINVMVGITRSKVIDYFVYPSTCLSVFLFVSLSYFAFLPRHFTMPSTSMYFGSSCMAQAACSSAILWYQQRTEKTLSLWGLCDLL